MKTNSELQHTTEESDWTLFWVIGVFVVFFISVLFFAYGAGQENRKRKAESQQVEFSAWSKVNSDTDLSLEEWKSLKSK